MSDKNIIPALLILIISHYKNLFKKLILIWSLLVMGVSNSSKVLLISSKALIKIFLLINSSSSSLKESTTIPFWLSAEISSTSIDLIDIYIKLGYSY